MALFSFGKKKKDELPAAMPTTGLPVDNIISMRKSGYQDYQISEILQNQGFNSTQVLDAFNQANMSSQQPTNFSRPGGPLPQRYPDEAQQDNFEMEQPFGNGDFGMQPMPQQDMAQQQQYMENSMPPAQERQQRPSISDTERIEELAEAIIDEKWKELINDINKVIDWKEKTEGRLVNMEQGIIHLKEAIESLQRSLVAKISDYDKSINNVGIEIKAMEKVFQKILPSLTDSVSRLERISSDKAASPLRK